jgi:hypothetical protein
MLKIASREDIAIDSDINAENNQNWILFATTHQN